MTNSSYRYDNLANRLALSSRGAVLIGPTTARTNWTSEARTARQLTTFTYSTSYTYDPWATAVKWDSGRLTTSTYAANQQLSNRSGPAGVTTFTYAT